MGKFTDCKSTKDFLEFKYKDPSYGGETTQEYNDAKMDQNASQDYFLLMMLDVDTKKIYPLVCRDIDINVTNIGTEDEKFNYTLIVSNLVDIMNPSYHFEMIVGSCFSPFKGSRPTAYENVECILHSKNLHKFDGLPFEEDLFTTIS